MRAAILRAHGETPEVGDFDEPSGDGETVVQVEAAGLNPIDLRIASGQLAAARPPLPSVVGREGVGRLPDGRRVYFDGIPAPYGSMAERCPVDPGGAVEVPDGLEPAHAVCYGIAGLAAWLALESRAQLVAGESVLVLGASGAVGTIGVQAAKLLGAHRVVAAARSEEGLRRALELGADAAVDLDGEEDLPAALRAASDGGFDVVLDPLWGDPAVAALQALKPRGRLVHLGQSAGAAATIPSATVRFNELSILGHTNFAAAPEAKRAALERMFRHASAGELRTHFETVPLDEAPGAWRRQAAGPPAKLVVVL